MLTSSLRLVLINTIFLAFSNSVLSQPQQVPLLNRPFTGEYVLSNWSDHDLPFEFIDNNGFILNSHEEKASGIDGHEGYDWSLPEGTPLLAVADGTIEYAGVEDAFACPITETTTAGNIVSLRVSSGQDNFYVLYAHLSRIDVATNQAVKAGDILGLSGNTGCSSGPHLHFAIYQLTNGATKSKLIDPYGWYGENVDPWANHPEGLSSPYIWKDGEAPQRYYEFSQAPNPCEECASAIAITKVRWMGVKDDKTPNNEFIELTLDKRFGRSPYDISEMVLKNNAGKRFKLPTKLKLKAGKTLRIYSGKGINKGSNIYLGSKKSIWNNFPGDCVHLYKRGGKSLMYYFYVGDVQCKFVNTQKLSIDNSKEQTAEKNNFPISAIGPD